MPYYTDTATAPKIYLEYEPKRPEGLTYYVGAPGDTEAVALTRQVTTTRYEFRGLTKAAADSIADAKVDTYTTAKAERMNDAGAYKVSVVEQTITEWSDT